MNGNREAIDERKGDGELRARMDCGLDLVDQNDNCPMDEVKRVRDTPLPADKPVLKVQRELAFCFPQE